MTAQKITTPDAAALQRAAESWLRKPIRDAYERSVGIVVQCLQVDGEWCLVARFANAPTERRIFLSPRTDVKNLDFISPGNAKARYRPATDADLASLKQAAAARRRASA